MTTAGVGEGVTPAAHAPGLARTYGTAQTADRWCSSARGALAGLAVGAGVNVVPAVGRARRAVRIAPAATISDRRASGGASTRRRLCWVACVAFAGSLLIGAGLTKLAVQRAGLGRSGGFRRRRRARRRAPGRHRAPR